MTDVSHQAALDDQMGQEFHIFLIGCWNGQRGKYRGAIFIDQLSAVLKTVED